MQRAFYSILQAYPTASTSGTQWLWEGAKRMRAPGENMAQAIVIQVQRAEGCKGRDLGSQICRLSWVGGLEGRWGFWMASMTDRSNEWDSRPQTVCHLLSLLG